MHISNEATIGVLLFCTSVLLGACGEAPTALERTNPHDPAFDGFVPQPSDTLTASVQDGVVTLTWPATTAYRDGYVVEKAAGAGTAFEELATLEPTATAYIDDTNDLGFETRYRVRPFKERTDGERNWGAYEEVTLTFGIPEVAFDLVREGEARVVWLDALTFETGFEVQRTTDSTGSGFETVATVPAGVTEYAHQGVFEWGKTYSYRVRALRGEDASSYTQARHTYYYEMRPPEIRFPWEDPVIASTPTSVTLQWQNTNELDHEIVVERRVAGDGAFVEADRFAVPGFDRIAMTSEAWGHDYGSDESYYGVVTYEAAGLNPDQVYDYRFRAETPSFASSYRQIQLQHQVVPEQLWRRVVDERYQTPQAIGVSVDGARVIRAGSNRYGDDGYDIYVACMDDGRIIGHVTDRALDTLSTSGPFTRGASTAAAYDPVHDRVAIAVADRVDVWDLATMRPVHALYVPDGYITALAFGPQGEQLFASTVEGLYNAAVLWNTATWNEEARWRMDGVGGRETRGLALSIDGRYLVAYTGRGMMAVYDVEARHEVQTLTEADYAVFDRSGRLVVLRPGRITTLDVESGRETTVVEKPLEGTFALSAGGRYLYGAARRGEPAGMWDLERGVYLRTLPTYDDAPTRLAAVSPAGSHLVLLSADVLTTISLEGRWGLNEP